MTMTTIADVLYTANQRLQEAGVDTAALDAELLLAHALQVDRTWVLAHENELLPSELIARFDELVARRAAREPLAYLTGQRWFFDFQLRVTPDVLVPRPETEELVERALHWLRAISHALVADVGTGSGAIALAVAKHAPSVHVYATDISVKALRVAHENAERLGLTSAITFLHGDLLTPLPQPVDLILANLPYVAEVERAHLMPEVGEYEPPEALFSGPEGLDHIVRLLDQAPSYVRQGGCIILEIGDKQGAKVARMAQRQFPGAAVNIYRDLAGLERFVEIDGIESH